MKAVIYARFSSYSQTEQSIEGQLRVCNEYAQQHGYTITKEYIDRAMTGTNDNRPSFLQMIEDAKTKTFTHIIVYKLDRFSRNTYDSVFYKHQLELNGVKVISATENITDSMEGKLIERILETMAEMYSADLSQKVKRGLRESILKKNFLGGIPPYGYKVENKKLIPDEEKSKIAKLIFEKYADGTPKIEIVKYLNLCGYKNNFNKPFALNSIQKMLKNKKYIGILTHNNEDIEDYCPPIITKELFNKTQELLNKNKHHHPKREKDNQFLLSGKVYCGYCGSPIVGTAGTSHTKKTHSYYNCSKKYRYHTCNKQSENKEKLEEEIINSTIFKIKKKKKDIIKTAYNLSKSLTEDNQITEHQKQINKINNELDKIFNQFTQTTNKELLERLNTKANDLTLQKETIAKELKRLELLKKVNLTEKEIEIQLNKLIKPENLSTHEGKKNFIKTFVNVVYVFDDKTTIYINTSENNKEITLDELNADLSIISEKIKGSHDNSHSPPDNYYF